MKKYKTDLRLPPCYIIYHPQRDCSIINKHMVYHDRFGGNEDPYIWNRKFLHSFCHMTQMSNKIGQINFWVSSNNFQDIQNLYCDCVFVIGEKIYWVNDNRITPDDPMVDNNQAFQYHYSWVNPPHNEHHFTRRHRYTLKADSKMSFQPQNKRKELIDILPFLIKASVSRSKLIKGMHAGYGSSPFKLDSEIGVKLYKYLCDNASIKIKGPQLHNRHPNNNNKPSRSRGCC